MITVNTLFVIFSSLAVFLMTPALAFFYGGLVSKQYYVNTLFTIFFITSLAILLWFSIGYSLSFSGNIANITGNLKMVFLHNLPLDKSMTTTHLPISVDIFFQMMFAIITPALFVGSIIGRVRIKFLIIFIIFWSVLIYYPLVHMIWGHGILQKIGVLDFAGGTVVHVNAGITALVLAILVGPRKHLYQGITSPASVLLGTTFLWIGWYGFNAGSALAINAIALQAILTTTFSAAAAMLIWGLLEISSHQHLTLIGSCTGVLCGLVAITPAAGYVSLMASILIGASASIFSYFFIMKLKPRLKIDDTLDAFGCHGISGLWGSLATGLFANPNVNKAVHEGGLFINGNFHLLSVQFFAILLTVSWVTIGTMIIFKVLTLLSSLTKKLIKNKHAS